MAPHIEKMKENIARACEIDKQMVNVKATTEEGLGFTGNKEGISAYSICLIESPRDFATMDVAKDCSSCGGCCRE